MSHHHSKIETLDLLLEFLLNYYPHQCPYSYCRCRCHQRRTTQIDTTVKQRRTPQQVLESRHLTETLEKIVKKKTLELETNE